MTLPDFADVLRERGSKATPGRIALLGTLWKSSKPVTVTELGEKLPGLNEATLYRALEALADAGLVRRIDFRHAHAHYELNALRAHHHHVICTGCGKVEDADCEVAPRLKKSSSFKVITDHAVEFFGICRVCAPA